MHDLLVEKTIAAYKHLAGHHDQDTYAGTQADAIRSAGSKVSMVVDAFNALRNNSGRAAKFVVTGGFLGHMIRNKKNFKKNLQGVVSAVSDVKKEVKRNASKGAASASKGKTGVKRAIGTAFAKKHRSRLETPKTAKLVR